MPWQMFQSIEPCETGTVAMSCRTPPWTNSTSTMPVVIVLVHVMVWLEPAGQSTPDVGAVTVIECSEPASS
jgi:hypothetical protein